MPLILVSAWDKRGSKYVRGDTCDEIITAASQKLGVLEKCKLFIDSTGVDAGAEIDEDEILISLVEDAKSANQKIAFFIAPEGRSNEYIHGIPSTINREGPEVPQGAGTDSTSPATPEVPSTSTPGGERSSIARPVLPMDSIRVTLQEAKEKILRQNNSLDLVKVRNQAARSIAKDVVQHILRNVPNEYSRDVATFYGNFVMNCDGGDFAVVFEQWIGNEKISDGRAWFICKIYNGLNYKKPIEAKKKRPKEGNKNDEELPKRKRRGIAKDYGCKEYFPALPRGETVESQEIKRQRLLSFHEMQDWGRAAEEVFLQTYASQRHAIIGAKPMSMIVTGFIKEWPIFKRGHFLLMHGEKLTGVSVTRWHELLGERTPDIIKFMRSFWASEEVSLRNNRSKRSSAAADMQKLIEAMDAACTADRASTASCAAVFPLLCGYMNENFDMMVVVMPLIASEEDVMSAVSVANENPIILIQGDGIFDTSSISSVYLLNSVRIEAKDFLEAVLIWFMTFFVFDFCYTREVQNTLEFIQRFFLGINPPTGDRREIRKRNVSVASDKVITLVEELRLVSSPWVVPVESEDEDRI